MKTIKTRSNQRNTYIYTDALGVRHTLKPGDVDLDSGYVLTEEDIKRLHRMDDNEVYNNVKNTKRPVEEWEKPFIEEWKKAHPNEDLPSRSHVSLDAEGEDDEGINDDADKGYLGDASLAVTEKEDPMLDRLHEVVEMLRPDQQELYRRIITDEENPSAIAKELGVDKSAITHRMNTIKRFIEKISDDPQLLRFFIAGYMRGSNPGTKTL